MTTAPMRVARWLRNGVMFVLALTALLALVALLVPSRWQVERSAHIDAAPASIYPQLAAPRQWSQWTAWGVRRPPIETGYEGPASGVGAVSVWRDARGHGRLTVTAAEPDREVSYELVLDGGRRTHGRLTLLPEDGGTRVTWTFEGDAGRNPLARYFGFMVTRRVADDFDAGLARLKRLCEGGGCGE